MAGAGIPLPVGPKLRPIHAGITGPLLLPAAMIYNTGIFLIYDKIRVMGQPGADGIRSVREDGKSLPLFPIPHGSPEYAGLQ